ncbi:cornifelin homolog [Symsagittifera roscoffensis]|uniref:cornifelin homolog n=1 Tax=Symsagittifera roscoffensis TaxID=84072 RepID=UPI00307B5DB4
MTEWKESLFGCFSDCKITICVFLVPCYVQGKIAESMGDSCILYGCAFLIPLANLISAIVQRVKVREHKSIDGSSFGDCMAVLCCYPCALCQEAIEVEANLMAEGHTQTPSATPTIIRA